MFEYQFSRPSVRTIVPPEQRGSEGSFNRIQYHQFGNHRNSLNQNHQRQQQHSQNQAQHKRHNSYNFHDRYNTNNRQQSFSYLREEQHKVYHPNQSQNRKQIALPPCIPPPSTTSFITEQSYASKVKNQNITLPPIIQLPKQHVDFISCNLPYEEGKLIEGLRIVVGPVVEPDYNIFCESRVVHNLLQKKDSIESVSHEKFTEARHKSNPYEKVGNSIFMNRAAVKLACLDSLIGLTTIKSYDPDKDHVFCFADICGGPGGFTEYLLWRKLSWGEQVSGWGITLNNVQNFDLNRFYYETNPRKYFKPCYGADDTGDLYKEDNIKDFARTIKDGTRGIGVDLVTADGGFDVRGQEQYQEIHLKQLILCQVVTMFMILRKNGDFVLKLFDIFTPFTGGIVWILYRHFEKICIIKPLSSRPANSERYIICQNLRENNPAILCHLFKVNQRFNELKTTNKSTLSPKTKSSLNRLFMREFQSSYSRNSKIPTLPKEDINEIIDISEINKDQKFLRYIKQKNIEIAKSQIKAIEQLLNLVKNSETKPPNQDEFKKLCLREWGLPSEE
ncbi:6581_t:CDS:10 [Funneliformis caledonium]|uniref:Cap-specific mRNA (nucleoside-2'-O-)-methyltransferase 1 n=1 Tax=Funneliformis caledonium TaxID=1117310 RepID=A0A9N8WAK4_9GLOM|nr:6581_t:CDS:10 [Funneliformis caledonium]